MQGGYLGWPRGSPTARKRALLGGVACLALVFVLFRPILSCLGQAGFAYLYWLRPELHYAVPAPGGGAAAGGAAAGGSQVAADGLPVPPIIHQTWMSLSPVAPTDSTPVATRKMPDNWKAARKSCKDLHPDHKFMLWTDTEAMAFLKEHYPWFLPTYLSYPYGIQRVDSIRYFILYHYGGIYLDLDMGCSNRLDFLREHNFTAPLAYPIGISNNFMAARPGSAFLATCLKRLEAWNRWMGIKYVQVMFSAGPMFLTVQYSLFPRKSEVGVVSPSLYGDFKSSDSIYVYHLHGSSWHAEDAKAVLWLDKHKGVLFTLGALAGAGLLLLCVCPRCLQRAGLWRAGYKATASD